MPRPSFRSGILSSLLRFVDIVVLWVALLFAAAYCLIVFGLMNRTIVQGAPNLRPRPNLIIWSNHQSMIDSFLVGWALFIRTLLWKPWLAPWHLPDWENYLNNPMLRHFISALRVIPVHRDEHGERHDLAAFKKAIRVLQADGMVHIFPGGGRDQTTELRPAVLQAGSIALLSGGWVRPVHFAPMHDVQPYLKENEEPPRTMARTILRLLFGRKGAWILYCTRGNRIVVTVGPDLSPAQLETMAGDGNLRQRSERLAAALTDELRRLKTETDRRLRSAS